MLLVLALTLLLSWAVPAAASAPATAATAAQTLASHDATSGRSPVVDPTGAAVRSGSEPSGILSGLSVSAAAREVPTSAPDERTRGPNDDGAGPSLPSVEQTLVLSNNSLVPGNFPATNALYPEFVAVAPELGTVLVTGFDPDPALSVLNVTNDSIVANVLLPSDPFAPAWDPVQGEAFVTEPNSDAVAVVNLTDLSVVAQVPVGDEPFGLAYDPAVGELFVADYGSNATTVINASNDSVVATVPVGVEPYAVAPAPALGEVFVSDSGSNATTAIATSNDTVLGTYPTPRAPYGLAYDPTHELLYATEPGYPSGNVTVLNATDGAVVASVRFGTLDYAIADDPGLNEMFVSNFGVLGAGNVYVLNASDGVVLTSFSIGTEPYGLEVDAAADQLFVANAGGGTVAVVVLPNDLIVSKVHLGSLPVAAAYDPRTDQVFVANDDPDVLQVISGQTERIVRTIVLSAPPVGVAYDPLTSQIWVTTSAFSLTNPFGTGGLEIIDDSNDTVAQVLSFGIDPQVPVFDPTDGTLITPDFLTSNLTVRSAANGSQLARYPVVGYPTSVAYDPAQNELFVGLSPFFGLIGPSALVVLNAGNGALLDTLPLTGGVLAVTYDGALGDVFAANGTELTTINATTDAVQRSLTLGGEPDAVVLDGVTGQLLVPNYDTDSVSVVSIGLGSLVGTVPVGYAPTGLALDGQDGLAYVENEFQGTVSLLGAPSYEVNLTQSGLGNATLWSASLNGTVYYLTGTSLGFAAPNGSFPLVVTAGIPGFVSPQNDSIVQVEGAPLTIEVRFFLVPVVRFVESGLPAGWTWTVTVGSTTRQVAGTTLLWTLGNGSFRYSIGRDSWYSVSPAAGVVTLSGANGSVSVSFRPAPTFSVTILESGLPSACRTGDCLWGLAVGTPAMPENSTRSNVSWTWFVAQLPAGTLPFTAVAPAGWGLARIAGPGTTDGVELNITGSSVVVLTFATLQSVGFTEVGLPPGTGWGVTMTSGYGTAGAPSQTATTTGSSLTFAVPTGPWDYQVTERPLSEAPVHGHGELRVGRSGVSRTLRFEAVVERVTFTESGLPGSSRWEVSLSGAENLTLSGKGRSLTVELVNGTYAYAIPLVGGRDPAPASGTLVVVAPHAAVKVGVEFSPGG